MTKPNLRVSKSKASSNSMTDIKQTGQTPRSLTPTKTPRSITPTKKPRSNSQTKFQKQKASSSSRLKAEVIKPTLELTTNPAILNSVIELT